jgi:predicted AAA+ superfamily ATPase
MDETPKDLQKMNVSELKEDLKQSEIRLKDLNEAAELAFKVIKEKENIILNEISALREEIKKRSGRG